jgi:polyhydroxyalkanoate synthase subunit PhaE
MVEPDPTNAFRPDASPLAAAERFFELLRSLAGTVSGENPDWSTLAAPLARQFEQWLRASQPAAWWSAFSGASPAASAAAAPWFTQPPPLGPAAAAGGSEMQRTFELLGRLAQLQGQLALHWREVAETAARAFVARMETSAAAPVTLDQALKLYELWVSCAEEAYAATAHREDFSRLQAELVNTATALLLEQRRGAGALARMFGLPTKAELDALHAEVSELRAQLAELSRAARPPGRRAPQAHAGGRARPAPGSRAKSKSPRAAGHRGRARKARR